MRFYLWSYPAGIDWLVRLADDTAPDTARKVFRAAYWSPLAPAALADLWTEGPTIGGDG